ncbi:hypothetical protein [Phenylobacterium sp.]|uniref:hypothetical protein n=1 Tax=Phenylobacterium sp. TaxID=1871053 RepID=UPI002DE7CA28|nr:hypothetical protein [Phenylobacterium sp.]
MAVGLAAFGAQAGDYHPPRTAWGAPDLGGLWSNNSLTGLERDPAFKALAPTAAEGQAYEAKHLGKPPVFDRTSTVGGPESEWWDRDIGLARIRGQLRTSWIVSPADGQLPYTAAAKAFHQARRQSRREAIDDPESRDLAERCMDPSSIGPPMVNGGVNDNYQFVQTRDAVAIHAEWDHDVRVIRIDPAGRHPPPTVRRWMGDSIGHWEGDTLVVETTNFTAHEIDAPRQNATDDMRVVERFTRSSAGEIFYEFSVTAPAVFLQTWRGEMVFHATRGPIYEFACHEGNYALQNMLLGARHAETRPPNPSTTASAK